uniref:tRNA:m(4)X modification enzyme TRM13 n=1 Tax=Albugo laibachii Nc14 TaxID=890382 RepID=F0W120_9STRA|nr:tRNA guanosine2'Omethyltransferase putative [Albugo laibachii Nc14]|eukprot:CCA14744.1 tRNA guanosine2'Omethyltransferase putative [Albugo laibachii Nc14]
MTNAKAQNCDHKAQRNERKTNAINNENWNGCMFKIKGKNRFCNIPRISGSTFCGNHIPNELTSSANESLKKRNGNRHRVPCPLDPSHTVYAFDVGKHIKICTKFKEQKTCANLLGYKENINSGYNSQTYPWEHTFDGRSQTACTPQLLDRLLSIDHGALLSRIEAAFNEYVEDIPMQHFEQSHCSTLLHQKIQQGAHQNSLRHIQQQGSILGNIESTMSLTSSHVFMELGAGRGMLSYATAQAFSANEFILIDRAASRGKADHRIVTTVDDPVKNTKPDQFNIRRAIRVKIDIRHLNIAAIPQVNGKPLVFISKHLCGVATDLSLRAISHLISDSSAKTCVDGVAIALCCHHMCSWDDYINPSLILQMGFQADDYWFLKKMTSWATCKLATDKSSVQEKLGLSPMQRARIGISCKRLLDTGRVLFLRSLGLQAKLVYYCRNDDRQSLESIDLCVYIMQMQNEGAAIKLENIRGLHEEYESNTDDNEASDKVPLDAKVLHYILESMGAPQYETRVTHQLLEFIHRYLSEILLDAHAYAVYAGKETIAAQDIRVAIASRLNKQYAQIPSHELTMELADKRNSIPLPSIPNEYGVHLPPPQFQLLHHDMSRWDETRRGSSHSNSTTHTEASATIASFSAVEGSRNVKKCSSSIKFNIKK